MIYKKILGCHFFKILPKTHPALIEAFAEGLEIDTINSIEQATIKNLLAQPQGSPAGEIIKNGIVQITDAVYQVSQDTLSKNFAKTEIGKRMVAAITKSYQEQMFKKVAKTYDKLLENEATEEIKAQFFLSHEISIVQESAKQELLSIQAALKIEFPDLTIQPKLRP
jgi:hypothetical protein